MEARDADGAAIRPVWLLLLQSRAQPSRHTFMLTATDLSTKFWLSPVQLAGNFGFRAHELCEITIDGERFASAAPGDIE
jgi:hypothetical protein